jgi:hypothetical protein
VSAIKAELPRNTRLVRFAAGLAALALLAAFFMSGITPPGACGEVLRHNRAYAIDASPLFYSEVANMATLEEGVRQMRQRAAACEAARRYLKDTESQHAHTIP